MMLESSIRLLTCRRCSANPEDAWSKRLGELCRLLFFPLNYNALQRLSKLLWGEEDGSTPEGEVKRGR